MVRWPALFVINSSTIYPRQRGFMLCIRSVIGHSINLLSPRSSISTGSSYSAGIIFDCAFYSFSAVCSMFHAPRLLVSSRRLLRESKCQFASVSTSSCVPSVSFLCSLNAQCKLNYVKQR